VGGAGARAGAANPTYAVIAGYGGKNCVGRTGAGLKILDACRQRFLDPGASVSLGGTERNDAGDVGEVGNQPPSSAGS
jgi:hypothetical protein